MTCKEMAVYAATLLSMGLKENNLTVAVEVPEDVSDSIRITFLSGETFDLAVLKIRNAKPTTEQNNGGLHMWKVYDAMTGEPVYESEYAEDCAKFVSDKEAPERFHLVAGMKEPVWNIEGGLYEIAKEIVDRRLESVEDGDYTVPAAKLKSNPVIVEAIIAHCRSYIDIDLDDNESDNFNYAVLDAIANNPEEFEDE